ncbi:MAG: peptidoglycan-associated lipoprotein [Candidatus Rokubacteria bacterium 13_1_40CM_4_69_5]|nr:MAG: peptidoglycan-associated lipoprotein [Candidatus Rokubacteria bacterium 13_1_40CM_4_69_5]
MLSRRWSGMVASLLVLSVVLAGCAKRPATTQASAPAPAGAAGSTPSGTGGGAGAAGPVAQSGPGAGTQPSGPAAAPTSRPEPREFTAIPDLKDINFDFDKYDIRPGDAKVLDANAAWLKSNQGYLVLIEGHCDERGTNEYNLALGERRAKAAMNYLVSQGVQASRITIISYGEERPLCSEHSEGCWAKNRRAHFLGKPR